MEIIPATLKIIEKRRKYHFNLSQSIFTPRNNSTGSLSASWEAGASRGHSALVFSSAGHNLAAGQLSYRD
jgi:hypothetical protein